MLLPTIPLLFQLKARNVYTIQTQLGFRTIFRIFPLQHGLSFNPPLTDKPRQSSGKRKVIKYKLLLLPICSAHKKYVCVMPMFLCLLFMLCDLIQTIHNLSPPLTLTHREHTRQHNFVCVYHYKWGKNIIVKLIIFLTFMGASQDGVTKRTTVQKLHRQQWRGKRERSENFTARSTILRILRKLDHKYFASL